VKRVLLIISIIIGLQLSAQDIDIYKHQKNTNFNLPVVPKGMTYDEFKILSTDLRMQDMVIAAILPGHVHFKIGETNTGYYILATRSLGYAGWVYLSLADESLTNIIIADNTLGTNVSTGDVIIAYGSLALIFGSYLYDWIHGRYKLDEKQNRIRYKYAKQKLSFNFNIIENNFKKYPALAISYNF